MSAMGQIYPHLPKDVTASPPADVPVICPNHSVIIFTLKSILIFLFRYVWYRSCRVHGDTRLNRGKNIQHRSLRPLYLFSWPHYEYHTVNGANFSSFWTERTDVNHEKWWRIVSSGLLRRVALVRTDVSEEPGASFIRVTKIGELGTTQAATSNRRTLQWNTKVLTRVTRRNNPEDTILHSHRRENLKSYMRNGVFWDVTPCTSCKNRCFGGS
jgi:hypothetical protein